MGLEERNNRAAEQIANIILDEGFDHDEAVQLIRLLYKGMVIEDAVTECDTTEQVCDKIFTDTSNFAKECIQDARKLGSEANGI